MSIFVNVTSKTAKLIKIIISGNADQYEKNIWRIKNAKNSYVLARAGLFTNGSCAPKRISILLLYFYKSKIKALIMYVF